MKQNESTGEVSINDVPIDANLFVLEGYFVLSSIVKEYLKRGDVEVLSAPAQLKCFKLCSNLYITIFP
jgi:hypothetical protein